MRAADSVILVIIIVEVVASLGALALYLYYGRRK